MVFLRHFWQAIVAVGTLFGILFLAKDAYDLPDAIKAWGPLVPDRERALLIFASVLVTWIVWSDIRPFVRKYFDSRKLHPIEIGNEVYCESHLLKIEPSPDLWDNVYYLIVHNNNPDGRTLRQVSASLIFIGPPQKCSLKDTRQTAIDIRHGERAFFEIGRIVAKAGVGLPQVHTQRELSAPQTQMYLINIPRGHIMFELPETGAVSLGMSNLPDDSSWKLQIVVSADDVPARIIKFSADLRALTIKLETAS
jgi:hypothetical protein